MRWQHIEWKSERAGYFFLFAILILGACGPFSTGVISDVTVTSADGALLGMISPLPALR